MLLSANVLNKLSVLDGELAKNIATACFERLADIYPELKDDIPSFASELIFESKIQMELERSSCPLLYDFLQSGDGYRIFYSKKILEDTANSHLNVLLTSYLVHELLHLRQAEFGLVEYGAIVEGPTWTAQTLYGASKVGLPVYESSLKAHSAHCLGLRRQDYVPSYPRQTLIGMGIVKDALQIDLETPQESAYQKFTTVFDQPRYADWNVDALFQLIKEQFESN